MKTISKYIGILLLLTVQSVALYAKDNNQTSHTPDIMLVYSTWERVFDDNPDTLLTNPSIKLYSPYEFEVEPADSNDKALKKYINHGALALYDVNDNVWLVNSRRLKDEFKGDAKKLDNYVPLYFSAKIAFVKYLDCSPSLGSMLLDMFFNGIMSLDTAVDYSNDDDANFFLIDFDAHEIKRVDHKKLQSLLEPYTDLLRRYTTMKNYKETYIINDYFLEYVNRLNEDPSVPYLF
ncbi:MAG: hypothetical protein IK092_06000, partial [Muribaculaceae bacterium]|nr:hypothetical protein [Muribaculaceae bacterium]